ncbi:MAG: trehalose-phosphatase [Anaerolineales bacterium]|jgi:trehalose 6-phosphate phosphatase
MYWKEAIEGNFHRVVKETKLGLVSDMDGTLSPIVNDPDEAQVTDRNRHLLRELQDILSLLAVISGRAPCDVQKRVGLEGVIYIGNHGLERCIRGQIIPHQDLEKYRPLLKSAKDRLEPQLGPGTQLEDKGATLSIHFRRTNNPRKEEMQLSPKIQEIANEFQLRFTHGRMVFELRPPLKVDKGSALKQIVVEQNLKAVIYLGDDTTDVAAMRMCRTLRKERVCDAWGIGVLSPGMPERLENYADFFVDGVSEVEEFLDWLLMSRKASSTWL